MTTAFTSGLGLSGRVGGADLAPIRAHGARRRDVLAVLVVLTIGVLSLGSMLGYVDNTIRQRHQNEILMQIRDARLLLDTVGDARAAMRGYVLTAQLSYLKAYYQAIGTLGGEAERTLPTVSAAKFPGASMLAGQLAHEHAAWDAMIAEAGAGRQIEAVEQLGAQGAKAGITALSETIGHYIDTRSARWERNRAALALGQNMFLMLNAGGGIGTILALIYAFRRSGAEAAQREDAVRQAVQAREAAIVSREEVRKIFAMAQALQGADGLADGAAILRASAIGLLPRLGGALYLFNAARDQLDLVTAWSPDLDHLDDSAVPGPAAPFVVPQECWAIKRTKPHLNGDGPEALRCCHAPVAGCSLEVPMIGRNEPLGLLVLTDHGAGGTARLADAMDSACVLAHSMSLGLSSILLRDKLREQAVRDSLTGLYNRRFLEEVLPTMAQQAQRRHACLAAIMIDLDHFKRLNDEHGHAMGDAVLKLVSATLLAALRGSDVACRYGGEELLVLLPDCTLEMARAKAEDIRVRIAGLSRADGPRISASLGVSAVPGGARDSAALLASADAALYRAKDQGRNRVAVAAPMLQPAIPAQPLAEWGPMLIFPPPVMEAGMAPHR